ncbi:MAG: RNA-directed DNA polymerase [Bacilli bacterium]|nr:RNA-directed DNA polymerase [Bacilli bacterium]
MKRVGHIYQKVANIQNIECAFNEVMKTTRNKNKVILFEQYKMVYIYQIYKDMLNCTYLPSKVNEFIIYEPKKRLIVSQNIYDKIVNHLVSRELLIPYLTSCLIDSNVASRKGKGTSYGRKLYFQYRDIMDKKYFKYYLLKIDICGYFRHIKHDVLKNKIEKRIKDKKAIDLIFKIIDSYPDGCPIGFMTSQIFAIFYLNEIDHFIKEDLKIKYYIRYQDDFLLIHEDKQYLKYCLEKIKIKLAEIGLEINEKTRIYKNNENMNFIGVRKNKKFSNRHRTIKKVNQRIKLYRNNKISFSSIISSISYLERGEFH